MKALLLGWTTFLIISVVLTAVGYYAWLKTSGRGFHFLKLSRPQLDSVAAMSFAAPILAACFQSTWVVSRGIRFYTALLWDLLNPGLWVFVTVEALLTFILLWSFMKIALWFRWPVLLICLLFWTYIGFETMAVSRGYA